MQSCPNSSSKETVVLPCSFVFTISAVLSLSRKFLSNLKPKQHLRHNKTGSLRELSITMLRSMHKLSLPRVLGRDKRSFTFILPMFLAYAPVLELHLENFHEQWHHKSEAPKRADDFFARVHAFGNYRQGVFVVSGALLHLRGVGSVLFL